MNLQHNPSSLADVLNAECSCMTLDRHRLIATLQDHVDVGTLWSDLAVTHPHLFAATPAFISRASLARMNSVVQAIEKLARSTAFQQTALEHRAVDLNLVLCKSDV